MGSGGGSQPCGLRDRTVLMYHNYCLEIVTQVKEQILIAICLSMLNNFLTNQRSLGINAKVSRLQHPSQEAL